MKAVKAPAAPAGLGVEGKRLWRTIAEDVAAEGLELDVRELRMLRDAAKTADELAVIEKAMAKSSPTVPGSMGQLRPNPLFDEARKARKLIADLLRQLSLDAPAEPLGRGARTTSTSARSAALVRRYGSQSGVG